MYIHATGCNLEDRVSSWNLVIKNALCQSLWLKYVS